MEDIYRSQFRIPYSLYELLKASADENRRSVNAELISRLEASFSKREVVRHKLGLPLAEEPSEGGDEQEAPRFTTGIQKERLLVKHDDLPQLQEDKLIAAMVRALRILEDEKAESQPNTGPKPRKLKPKA
ncbi:Arc family DNA-binding protein [Pseudomonas sp.]|uniref:Arc family DNA-binding protein n=1 Tax=Pseudomonas sp. TaxID=306 RepID=UPI00262800E2|nr:Arc family DNA-binding protein [Pseudomonas sp.]